MSVSKQRYLEKKEYEKNFRKLRRRLDESEMKIERLEAQISEFDRILSSPGSMLTDISDFYSKYQELKEKHSEEMNRWAQYTHDLEVFLKNNG